MQEAEDKLIDNDDPYIDNPVNIIVDDRNPSANDLVDKQKNSDLFENSRFASEEEFAGLRAAN